MDAKYMSLSQACAFLPGRPHVSTLARWRLRGVRGHKLQTTLVGGRRYITQQQLVDFLAAINGKPSMRPSEKAAGEPDAADKILDRLGI